MCCFLPFNNRIVTQHIGKTAEPKGDIITIFDFEFLLGDGGHEFDVTLELHFKLVLAFHVGCEGGVGVEEGDEKLELQHALSHGLQAGTEKGGSERKISIDGSVGGKPRLLFLLGTADQGELGDVLVHKVQRDGVGSSAPGVSVNHT